MCQHKTCASIRAKGAANAVAVAMVLNYHDKATNSYNWVLSVGKETGGQYTGQFNLCAGKLEQVDGGCYIKGARRELSEEFKIDATSQASFDAFFMKSSGRIRWFMHHRTPVFVGVLPAGFSRKPVKQIMAVAMMNGNLPHALREMSDFEYIRLDTGAFIDGSWQQVSPFANGIRTKIDITKL